MVAKFHKRRHAVLVRLDDKEKDGLDLLREVEGLQGAQVLRRLLIREVRASHQMGETVMVK